MGKDREGRMTSEAMPNREDMIRDRAYAIWIEDGRPDGMAEAHWHRASDALDAEEAAVSPLTNVGEEPAPLLVTPNR